LAGASDTLLVVGLALLLAIILVPVAEIWAAVQVAHHIGVLWTLLLLFVISAFGPRLVRRQGLGVWRRAQARLNDGELPGRELIDGVLLLVAGILLTVPGFLTGAAGALLLLPPVRAVVRIGSGSWLARRVRDRRLNVRVYTEGGWHDATAPGPAGPDGASREITRGRPELEPPASD
jgi:UPF0716 protein FxsA